MSVCDREKYLQNAGGGGGSGGGDSMTAVVLCV